MKPRLIKLTDLAIALVETTYRFSEKSSRLMEIHIAGNDRDITLLAAKVASILLRRKTVQNDLAQGIFVSMGKNPLVAFVDEKKRKTAIASGKPKHKIALPSEVRQATVGILFVAHPRKQRMFQQGPGGVLSQKTEPDIQINIRKELDGRPLGMAPRRVKIRAGGLSRPLHKEFKESIRPYAVLAH
jgi:hypothetical protein